LKAFTAATYLAKAERAVEGARVLLEAGDTEGACSRAYYAMFDAAHAALRAAAIEVSGAEIKTHNGLLAVFSKKLVETKQVPADLRKALNQVQHLRLLADYECEPPKREKTRWAIEQAEAFVAAIRTQFIDAEKKL
jgi:uncharacterized protein (UPF0332 family)